MKKSKTIYITQTAVMLALLIGAQFVTRSFGQFITGSLVNMILLISVYMIGLGGGLTVAVLSPFLAVFVGMGPAFIQIVPFMVIGNAILVLVASLARHHIGAAGFKSAAFTAIVVALAAAVKTAFLWIGLVIIFLPMIPGINEKQIAVISASFSWPQLVTALIGGALAIAVVSILKRAVKPGNTNE